MRMIHNREMAERTDRLISQPDQDPSCRSAIQINYFFGSFLPYRSRWIGELSMEKRQEQRACRVGISAVKESAKMSWRLLFFFRDLTQEEEGEKYEQSDPFLSLNLPIYPLHLLLSLCPRILSVGQRRSPDMDESSVLYGRSTSKRLKSEGDLNVNGSWEGEGRGRREMGMPVAKGYGRGGGKRTGWREDIEGASSAYADPDIEWIEWGLPWSSAERVSPIAPPTTSDEKRTALFGFPSPRLISPCSPPSQTLLSPLTPGSLSTPLPNGFANTLAKAGDAPAIVVVPGLSRVCWPTRRDRPGVGRWRWEMKAMPAHSSSYNQLLRWERKEKTSECTVKNDPVRQLKTASP
jgi:hypothetical protein